MASKSGSNNIPSVNTNTSTSTTEQGNNSSKGIPSISLGSQSTQSSSSGQNTSSDQVSVAGPWKVISGAATEQLEPGGPLATISVDDLGKILDSDTYKTAVQGLQKANEIVNTANGVASAANDIADAASKTKAPMTKEEEIAQQAQEMENDTRTKAQKFIDKINKIGVEIGKLIELAAAIGSAGVDTYKSIKSDVESIKNKVHTIKSTVNDIRNGQNAMQALINNPLDSGSFLQIGNDAFDTVDSAISFISDDFLSQPLLPSKIQDKLSQKEINRRLKAAQAKMEEYKQVVEDWIQQKSAAVIGWVSGAKSSVENAIATQTKRAVNAVAAFTGINPDSLESILEQAEAMGMEALMAKIQGKSYDMSTQLDILKNIAGNTGKEHLTMLAANITAKLQSDEDFEWTDILPGLSMFQKKTGENVETSATGVPKIDVSSIVNESVGGSVLTGVGTVGTSKPKVTIDNPLNSSSTSSTGNSFLIGVGDNTYSTANNTTSTNKPVDAHAAVNNKMENMKKDISRIVLGQ